MATDVAIGSGLTSLGQQSLPQAGVVARVEPATSAASPAPATQDTTNTPAPASPTGQSVYVGAFNLKFAENSPRFFLEARDPTTGAIIVQVPAQVASKGFQAAGRHAARGSKLDGSF